MTMFFASPVKKNIDQENFCDSSPICWSDRGTYFTYKKKSCNTQQKSVMT